MSGRQGRSCGAQIEDPAHLEALVAYKRTARTHRAKGTAYTTRHRVQTGACAPPSAAYT